jgi:hypothetical protein
MMNQARAHELFEYRNGRLHHKTSSPRRKAGDPAGCINGTGYRRIGIDGGYFTEHSLVFLMFHGYVPKEIDHINGDRADNRIENLRPVSRSQNQYNKRPQRNASGYRGVTWHAKTKKWLARVGLNNKTHSLGYFDDLELAALVAEEGRSLYYGQYAYDNRTQTQGA